MKPLRIMLFVLAFSALAGAGPDIAPSMIFATDTTIGSNFEVPPGVTCVIMPGVRIKFEGYYTFRVRGLLIAEGTRKQPVVFSSTGRPKDLHKDPAWKGIEILGSKANGRFKHCVVSEAFRTLAWESSPTFDSCEFTGNHYGIYCSKKASPLISNCKIHDNTYGIAVDFSFPLLKGNVISGNVVGLYLQLTAESIAGNNLIVNNETNIHIEKAYGADSASFHMQRMWKVMQQLY